MIPRYAIGVGFGAVVTLGLLLLMRAVIANPQAATDTGIKGVVVEFVRVREDREVIVEEPKPERPPPPEEPPPDLPKPNFNPDATVGIELGKIDINVNLNITGTGGFSDDGEYLPLVKIEPIYPRRALDRGIEGYVLLEFVVTATGSVRDPVVIEAKPPGMFDRAAIAAALKFKYKPKVVNNEAIEVAGVRNLIKFELKDD